MSVCHQRKIVSMLFRKHYNGLTLKNKRKKKAKEWKKHDIFLSDKWIQFMLFGYAFYSSMFLLMYCLLSCFFDAVIITMSDGTRTTLGNAIHLSQRATAHSVHHSVFRISRRGDSIASSILSLDWYQALKSFTSASAWNIFAHNYK